MRLYFMIVTLWTTVYFSDAYNILAFFPFPGKSHHKVWDPLLKELALRGHRVTALKSVEMENPPKENYREIAVKNILEDLIKMIGSGDSISRPSFFEKIFMILFFKSTALQMGELWKNDPAVIDLLNSNATYDAVLYESCMVQEYFTTLQHKFKAVGIEVSTVGNYHWFYWLFGNPIDTSYITDANSVDYSDHMTLFQRIHLTVISSLTRFIGYVWYLPQYQKFMDENIRYEGWQDRPSLVDMLLNTSIVLVNTDVALAHPHPMAPNFIEIGGINILPNNPLPTNLQSFMDSAKEGVIYFTLGSHIQVSSTLGDSLRDVFKTVFSRLKQKVLWKWEKDNFKDVPSNVMISEWFPQQDILAHKNLKLFISHGGFLSMTEAVYFGIPIVGIPIFADQDKNINFVQDKGMGLYLDLKNLTEGSVSWAINQVLTSNSFKENAMRQSKILRDKPIKPLDKAVFWTEYVIRHKGAHHLKTALATMPWYQQAMLDVYATLALLVLLPLYVGWKMIGCFTKFVCRFCCRSKDKESNEKKNK